MIRFSHGLIFLILTPLIMSELSKVNYGLEYELIRCLFLPKGHLDNIGHYSVIEGRRDISICWRMTMGKCADHHSIQTQAFVTTHLMCGVINAGKRFRILYNYPSH